MCLLLWSYGGEGGDKDGTDGSRFILASNRDEYWHRPSRQAGWHHFGQEEEKGDHGTGPVKQTAHHSSSSSPAPASCFPTSKHAVLSGIDGERGGTWLGLSRNGYFATVTNVQEPKELAVGKKSRGDLVRTWLAQAAQAVAPSSVTGTAKPGEGLDDVERYLAQVEARKMDYPGFNLLVGRFLRTADGTLRSRLGYVSNREKGGASPSSHRLEGVHGLGNSPLSMPWEKVETGVKGFTKLLFESPDTVGRERVEKVFSLLRTENTTGENPIRTTLMVPKTLLPNPFPKSAGAPSDEVLWYGTRLHTVLSIDGRGHVIFIERDAATDQADLLEAKRKQRVFEFDLV